MGINRTVGVNRSHDYSGDYHYSDGIGRDVANVEFEEEEDVFGAATAFVTAMLFGICEATWVIIWWEVTHL